MRESLYLLRQGLKMIFDNERWIDEILETEMYFENSMKFMQDEETIKRLIYNETHQSYRSVTAIGAKGFSSLFPSWEPTLKWTLKEYLEGMSINEIKEISEVYHSQELSFYLDKYGGIDDFLDLEATQEGRKKLATMRARRLIDDWERSIEIHKKQVFILISTYFELIVENFLDSLFNRFPEKMNSYIGQPHRSKPIKDGRIQLDIVLNSESREKLINKLSKTAVGEFLRKKNREIISEINKLIRQGGKGINAELSEKMIDLLEIRNVIVHRNESPDFSGYAGTLPYYNHSFLSSESALEIQALKVLEDFVVELGDICLRMDIPQNYYVYGVAPPSLEYEALLTMLDEPEP